MAIPCFSDFINSHRSGNHTNNLSTWQPRIEARSVRGRPCGSPCSRSMPRGSPLTKEHVKELLI